MMKTIGLLACVLIAALSVCSWPEIHLLAAGAAAALMCASGLLLPSLGLAITGAVASLLVFSISLLLNPVENVSIEAVLLGIALLIVLDATYYRQCFRRARIDRSVTREHLANLATTVIISLGVAALVAAFAAGISIGLDPSIRPVLAAAGAILVVGTVLRATPRDGL
jgi:hypothetical protein